MAVGRAVADGRPPLPLVAVTILAVAAGLVPMMVFGSRTALLVGTAGVILAGVFISIRRPRICWLLAVASLPITMAWPISASGANISFPLEILAGALAPLLLLTLFHNPHSIRRLLFHPLSIALGFQLAWMTGATVFSADPVVSAKALAVRVVYLTVFYIGGFLFLDRTRTGHDADPLRTTTMAVLFLAIPTTLWALASHAPFGFARQESYEIAQIPPQGSLLTLDLLGDESSTERLNRWNSAIRMLRDRPLFGFGPSTYERTYGTYQQHQQLTRVSTFRGDRGGAHSEFMTVAAEQGLGGVLSLVAVVILGLRSGLRTVRNAATSRDHWWAASWTAAFVALTISSCFNSLLELDKTAPLFWLAAAVLVSLDLSRPDPGGVSEGGP